MHKVQGLILNKVVVNCDGFDANLVYIALSRVGEMSNLHVEQFDWGLKGRIKQTPSRELSNHSMYHYDYSKLAGRIITKYLQLMIKSKFSDFIESVKEKIDKKIYVFISNEKCWLNEIPDLSKDFEYDYHAISQFRTTYLKKINQIVVELPQYLFLRSAIVIVYDSKYYALKGGEKEIASINNFYNDYNDGSELYCLLEKTRNDIKEIYYYLSERKIIYATPTLINACYNNMQLMSCFLYQFKKKLISPDGSIDFDTLYSLFSDIQKIIGVHGGVSILLNPIVKANQNIFISYLKMLSETVKTTLENNRQGLISVYISVWHSNIHDFLTIKNERASNEKYVHRLTTGIMENGYDLSVVFGKEFEKLYLEYEEKKLYLEQISAFDLMTKISIANFSTGGPYVIFRDV
ncbi:16852_t:CDS:2, partial [Racocetra persica]